MCTCFLHPLTFVRSHVCWYAESAAFSFWKFDRVLLLNNIFAFFAYQVRMLSLLLQSGLDMSKSKFTLNYLYPKVHFLVSGNLLWGKHETLSECLSPYNQCQILNGVMSGQNKGNKVTYSINVMYPLEDTVLSQSSWSFVTGSYLRKTF